MNKLFNKLSKRSKPILVIFIIYVIGYLVSYAFFANSVLAFKNIENLVRYSILIIFFVYFLFYFIYSLIRIIQKKYKHFIIVSIITTIFIAIFIVGTIFAGKIYNYFGSIGENSEINYKVYLIDHVNENVETEDVIGIISTETDEQDNMLSTKLLKSENLNNDYITYDDYFIMMEDFYNGEIDSVIVPDNYVTFFSGEEKYANIETETSILYEYSEVLKNEDTSITSNKDFSEPVTFLIMGVDSEAEGLDANASFNGDTLMLLTFNPHTLNVTMFSIPRDTLVPIACGNGSYAKINSSAAYGTQCVIDTVEDLTDITVDYYIKINFKGLVELVDALGGIEVNVEKPDFNTYGNNKVCEQDSNRLYSNLICMDSGVQTLNGEQALAYSRNRHQYMLGDIDRTRHQQEVVTALSNKAATLDSIEDFEKVFETVQNNIFSNMTEEQIFSGYNVFKEAIINASSLDSIVHVENSFLEVYNLDVYLNTSSSYISSSLGYYKNSLSEITKMMKINLELEDPEHIKSASFNINEPYESLVSGEGVKTGITTTSLPSFIGKTKTEAQTYCNNNGISCTFTTVDSNNTNYNTKVGSDLIGNQSVRISTLVNSVSKITFYINGEIISTPEPDVDETPIDPVVDDLIE